MIKYKSYYDFVNEIVNLDNHDDILFIVDVQEEFGKFIPENMVEELIEYCKEFSQVYQIWDTHDTKNPTFKFPNQVKSIEKKFGTKYLDKKIQDKLKQYQDSKKEGETLKIKGMEGYFIRVENNHKWFLINDELVNLFKKLKNKKIIITGGADQECLKDLYVAGNHFGIELKYNHNYIYSAETKQKANFMKK